MENKSEKKKRRKRTPKYVKFGKEARKKLGLEKLMHLATWIASNPMNSDDEGSQTNKATIISYIKRMFTECGFNLELWSDDSMRGVYKKIMDQYKKASDWVNHTGQGIEDENTFKDAVLKICPYYYILNQESGFLQPNNTCYSVANGEEVQDSSIFEEDQKPILCDTEVTVDETSDDDDIIIDTAMMDIQSQSSLTRAKWCKKSQYGDAVYAAIIEKEKLKCANKIELAKIAEEARKERLLIELESKRKEEQMRMDFQIQMLKSQEKMMTLLGETIRNNQK